MLKSTTYTKFTLQSAICLEYKSGLACNEVKVFRYNTSVVISSNWRVTK